jgi:membrane protease YdiL (CAAX protease family)
MSSPEQLPAENLPPSLTPEPSSDSFSSVETLTAPIAPKPSNHILYGPYGLRAGWSLLIYLAIAAAIILGIRGIGLQVKHARDAAAAASARATGKPIPPPVKADPTKPQPLSNIFIGETLVFGAFLFLSWIMSTIEHRKLSVFGLGGTHPIPRFLVGAVWGVVAISLLIFTLHVSHLLTFDARLDHGGGIFLWGGLQLGAFFLVGLVEEYVFRGYIQFTLTRGLVSVGNLISRPHARIIGFWIAAVITSAIFLLAHTSNAGENWLGLFQVFLAGLLFVVALWRTGSLWWGIGFHMAWDWGQSFLYGVPDSGGLMQGRLFATHAAGNPLFSGGTAGPEGSVLCIPVFLLAILVLVFTHSSPQPPLEIDPNYGRLLAEPTSDLTETPAPAA